MTFYDAQKFAAVEKEILSGEPVSIPEFLTSWLKRWKRLYINNQWSDGSSGEVFRTVNPATGEELSEVSLATKADVHRAVEAGRLSVDSGPWAQLSIAERAKKLRQLGDLIQKHLPALALLETLDTGKPIRETYEGDIPRAAQNFHFFADFAENEKTESYSETVPGVLHTAVREPAGVVALITPWNLPLYLETWKLAPALIMGNSVLLKPSELTPLTACYLFELITELDLPPGVVQLLQGHGENSTGEFLVSHPGIDAISFTGETNTGRAIQKAAAAGPTKISFELGGKGASIFFADMNWNEALPTALRAAFRNQGQICLATPRFFVEESAYEKFVQTFTERAAALKIGNPLSYSTEMGSLISTDHWEKVTSYLRRMEAPARATTGGERPAGMDRGAYLKPTVLVDVPLDHAISREEIFGPVVSIYPFKSESEVLAAANNTPYGLSASVWSGDADKASRVAKGLHTGLVWINSWFLRDLRVPFGGQKKSGIGREGGRWSLDFFSEWKSICVKQN